MSAAKNTSVKLVCYGGSATGVAQLKAGTGPWFADVLQMPATEGQVGMSMLIKALKTGKKQGSKNPVAGLPNNGILTPSNASSSSRRASPASGRADPHRTEVLKSPR